MGSADRTKSARDTPEIHHLLTNIPASEIAAFNMVCATNAASTTTNAIDIVDSPSLIGFKFKSGLSGNGTISE